jgi:hypothetical protein
MDVNTKRMYELKIVTDLVFFEVGTELLDII